jgi:hypothetical protein
VRLLLGLALVATVSACGPEMGPEQPEARSAMAAVWVCQPRYVVSANGSNQRFDTGPATDLWSSGAVTQAMIDECKRRTDPYYAQQCAIGTRSGGWGVASFKIYIPGVQGGTDYPNYKSGYCMY